MRALGYLLAFGSFAACVVGPVPEDDEAGDLDQILAASVLDATYTGKWLAADAIVNGWDWTLPPGTTPAPLSGIYQFGNGPVPGNFPGNRLKIVNVRWREVEPSRGSYDFSGITSEINDPDFDGVMLNVRGVVTDLAFDSSPTKGAEQETAPSWLQSPTTKEARVTNTTDPFQITNLVISDGTVKARLKAMIVRFGATGIPANPRVKGAIIHGVSSSQGEEWTGKQSATTAAVSAMSELIDAWVAAYGSHAGKLAWLNEDPAILFDAAVTDGRTGIRGGAIESWLRVAYTPGLRQQTGQILDDEGYLSVDESFAPIRDGRHFQDQNEEYTGTKTTLGPETNIQTRYRMSMLRSLQMRRNILAAEADAKVNPSIYNWVSLELGRKAQDSPDAWVCLMRTYTRSEGETQEVNNLERWLYQREYYGETVARQEVAWQYNASGNALLPKELWKGYLARRPASQAGIGIAIDTKFLPAGTHSVAIKVTFLDTGTDRFDLEYARGDGSVGTKSVKKTNSGQLRTATLFVPSLRSEANGLEPDFYLLGANTDFLFVRVIR